MDETEIEKLPEKTGKSKQGMREKFTILVFFAIILSIGSLAWTTFSLLDFFQPGGFDLAHIRLKDINPMGLAAAGTADVTWTLTMIAQYRGNRLMVNWTWGEAKKQYDLLPWIGWVEVLFVAGLLAKHGATMGSGGAAFAAALPLLTKLGWMVALADLKDPTAPSLEAMEKINAVRQNANVKLEMILATEEGHRADLEAQRRKNERLMEDKRAEAERLKLEQQTEFELERDRLRGENEIKLERMRMGTELQLETVKARAALEESRDEHEFAMSLRRRPQTIVGQTVPRSGLSHSAPLGITDGTGEELGAGDPYAGLTQSQRAKAELAQRWYQVDAQYGGAVTKAAFCQNQTPLVNPPRLSEATATFPPEWFMERGLADWLTHQN